MVIDTHVLYWWIEFPEKLSVKSQGLLENAEKQGQSYYLCSVSFWEIQMKVNRGLLKTRQPLEMWGNSLRQLEWLEIISTDWKTWVSAASLSWDHRDPADRIIASTALRLGVPVITKDKLFHREDCPVNAVW